MSEDKIKMIDSKKIPGIQFRFKTISSKKYIDVVHKETYLSIANLGMIAPIKGKQKDFIDKIEEVLSQLDWTLPKEEIMASAEHFTTSRKIFEIFERIDGYYKI